MRSYWLVLSVAAAGCGGDFEEVETSARGETAVNAGRAADFNGDGYDDLAIGVPDEDIDVYGRLNGWSTRVDAGAVSVFYGTASGISGSGGQRITAAMAAGTPYAPGTGDKFGLAVAWGDFNADGFDDLAVGAPGDDNYTGYVHVVNGSASGLTGTGGKVFTQANMGRDYEEEDFFGVSLAVGDFDANGHDDLAIGAPGHAGAYWNGGETWGGTGVVYTLSGYSNGLISAGNHVYQIGDGYIDRTPGNDAFGYALAVGNFDGDSRDELAVGAPLRDTESACCTHPGNGAVIIINFWSTQIVSHVEYFTIKDVPGFDVGSYDYFGSALATGDFNGGGQSELAVGIPGRERVAIFRPVDGGFDVTYWSQNSSGIGGALEYGDRFGSALASADFNDDGRDDLAIGARTEKVGNYDRAGAVNLIYGSSSGLTATGSLLIHQDVAAGVPYTNDEFGRALIVGDFDGNGAADLAVTIPNEDVGTSADAGQVQIFRGYDTSGLSLSNSTFWHQDTTSQVPDSAEIDDHFGKMNYGSFLN